MTPTPDPLLTSAAKRLDGAWPVDMDRLEWREALVSIEAEAIGLRAAAARDALALLAAARAADIILSATEAKALSAALDAAQPAPALDVDTLPELGRLTDYQRGYLHGFDAPVNVAARTPTPDPLREALDEAIRLTSGPGNGTMTRRRSIDEWRRLDRLFREALAQPAPALDVGRLQRIEAAAEALIWDLDHGHPTTAILRAEQRLRAALAEPQRLFASTNLLTE